MKYILLSFRVLLVISFAAITFFSTQEIILDFQSSINDKAIHIACFFYLATIFWLSKILDKDLWVYVIVLAYGILIEVVQMYIPYRSPELLDILADFTGILLASFLIKFAKDLYPNY
jgi:VanZ family protein